MANTHIVFGKMKINGKLDAMSYSSQLIANNATSANSSANLNYCWASAIGGAVWIAVATANGVANAANANTRLYIANNGTIEFTTSGSIKIHSIDA